MSKNPLDELTKRIEYLNFQKETLYDRLEQITGGPLHVILDDGNVRDSDIVFCYRSAHRPEVDSRVRAVCLAILHELMFMSEAQRWTWWENPYGSVVSLLEVENHVLVNDKEGYRVELPKVVG